MSKQYINTQTGGLFSSIRDFSVGVLRVLLIVCAGASIFSGAAAADQPETAYEGDIGIQSVSALITDLGLVQISPTDDINVALDWAYADGNRIALGWTVDYPQGTAIRVESFELLDTEHQSFPAATFAYGTGGAYSSEDRVFISSTSYFDARNIDSSPDWLTLIAQLAFTSANPPIPANPDVHTPAAITPFKVIFEFTVPFYPAATVNGEFSVRANDLSMSVKDLSYAPSIALATLCFEVPADGKTYEPFFATFDGYVMLEPASFQPSDPASTDATNGPSCGTLTIYAPIDPAANLLRFEVRWLQTYESEVTQGSIARLQWLFEEYGLGYRAEYVHPAEDVLRPYYNVNWTLEDESAAAMQFGEMIRLDAQALRNAHEGPWRFEIRLN